MLVITRKKDEGFLIGENIKITVVDVSGDRIKIGIDAPKDVKIIRNELYDTEKLNMQAAVHKPSADILAKLISRKKDN